MLLFIPVGTKNIPIAMNFPAASSGVSVGNHLNRPKGRGIKPLSASGGLVRLWRIEYFCYSPGLYKEAGEWFVEKGVKAVGVDQQALDHPLATAIGPHGPGPLRPDTCEEDKRETCHDVLEDFPLWEPCHNIILGNGIMGFENVGGDIDEVVGMRVTLAGFPIRWEKGDGSIVRLVAIVDEGDQ